MDINNLCMGCMKELSQNSAFCPHCGYKSDSVNSSRGLQPRSILNGKYLVGKIIGEGGFGITYVAYDLILNSRVAIKEYFPSELVTRDTSTGTQSSLTVHTNAKEEQYKAGIERFVQEAKNLAKFNNLEGIVSVKEFFYENNTAYMVMEYIDGVTLSKYLEKHGNKLPYDQVIIMMAPVMDSLEKIHAGSIVHRDISPDNIMVSDNGAVKLIDFGAARIVDNTDQKSLTVILKHGYAPEEQYQSHGNQGPWTDIYALSATMYRMITGIVPQESTDRILIGDKVAPVNKLVPEVPKRISDAIMHGLSVKAANRPQTITGFKSELEKGRKKILPVIIAGIAAITIVLGVAGIIIAVSFKEKVFPIANEEKAVITEEPVHPENKSELMAKPEPALDNKTEDELVALIEEISGYSVIPKHGSAEITEEIDDTTSYYAGHKMELAYRLYDDFDGDGRKELLSYVCTGKLDDPFSNHLYSAENTRLWYSNGIKTFEVEKSANDFWNGDNYRYTMPFGLMIMRFGKVQDICEVYGWFFGDKNYLYCQTYQVKNESVEPVIEYQEDATKQLLIDCDSDHNPIVYLLSANCMSENEFKESINFNNYQYISDNWRDSFYPYYYIYKGDDKYYIYGVTKLTENELAKYDNYNEILNTVETGLYSTTFAALEYQLWWDKPYSVKRGEVFKSDIDKIYVNYYLQTKPDVSPEDDTMWGYPSKDPAYDIEYTLTAIFTIKDNELYLDGFMSGLMNDDVNINGLIKMQQ